MGRDRILHSNLTPPVAPLPPPKNVRPTNKMGGKPRLPRDVELQLPEEIVRLIYTYVPKRTKPKSPPAGLQACLEKLQRSPKRNAMDLYGLDDFVLC